MESRTINNEWVVIFSIITYTVGKYRKSVRNITMHEKILFFDIDGTLIDYGYGIFEIPSEVTLELKRLQRMGHRLFISSGRPKAMLNDKLLSAGFDGYILTNGAYAEIDNTPVYENRMDYALSLQMVEMLDELGCHYMIETAGHIYIDRRSEALYQFFSGFGQTHLFVRDFDRNEVLKRALKIEANVTEEGRERVESCIRNHFGYVAAFDAHGTGHSFEIYSPTISKATGIKKILDRLGLSREDSYAFGDGTNDIEMIQYCGTGIAMGNAVPELKAAADIVCPPIYEHGLERILKELFP